MTQDEAKKHSLKALKLSNSLFVSMINIDFRNTISPKDYTDLLAIYYKISNDCVDVLLGGINDLALTDSIKNIYKNHTKLLSLINNHRVIKNIVYND